MKQSASRRLFFALWPGDEVRKQIAREFQKTPQSSMNGRSVSSSNYHITLHFIGKVGPEQQQCLHRAAQTVVADGFPLSLDCYGHFSKPRVFWLGCQSVTEPLRLFQKQLGEALSRCGYQADSRVYAPHVSLMRKLARPGDISSAAVIQWDVNEFVLVESKSIPQGVQYEVIKRYPLSPLDH